MPKNGILLKDLRPLLRDQAHMSGWSLCIGAGVSLPVFPSWDVLVRDLCGAALGCSLATIPKELNIYSFDSLITAAQNRLGLADDDFAKLLAEHLYASLKGSLAPPDFQLLCDTLAVRVPARNKKRACTRFLELFRSTYKNTSALGLAELLRDLADKDQAPLSVLSFNAEPLLPALTNALIYEAVYQKSTAAHTGELVPLFDLVTHSITNVKRRRIPYIFCHGLLPVPDPSGTKQRMSSPDKLVFSETSYLLLANSSFSWQSSSFLHAAASRTMVFAGVSLSDSNMRRWLTWVQHNRVNELKQLRGTTGDSTSHYWINKLPLDQNAKAILEAVVAHLGIRIIWIDEWQQLGAALRKLVGL